MIPRVSFLLTALALLTLTADSRGKKDKPARTPCWKVNDVRPGMKGYGRTVMKGTKIETFQVEVLGVLRNVSPARDMIVCRLSGLGLERSGIVAGMSGSPVYLENKLLGAVAYGWEYGKDPIAGITPFCQMRSFVQAFERRDLANKDKAKQLGRRFRLSKPLRLGEQAFEHVTVSQQFEADSHAKDDLWLTPLRTPLVASGMSARSLSLLREQTRHLGLIPVQGGGAGSEIPDADRRAPLVPGGPLAVAMIRGDFDLSGIGTVTHVEGERVFGWGHPFMSFGRCELPLMTGYVHAVCPRQSTSFKMGSPLRTVGVINADVSTCIAGWLNREPDLLPMSMTVQLDDKSEPRTFKVELARQPSMLGTLVFSALSASVDMEGQLPREITAEMAVRLELADHEPLVIEDTFSGFSGGRAASALYSRVASLVNVLARNDVQPIGIKRIDCKTRVHAGRRTAEIEAVELRSKVCAPGETLRAIVHVRPYKGEPQRLPIALKLPNDLDEGAYQATFTSDETIARRAVRDDPALDNPRNVKLLMRSLRMQTLGKRDHLAVRVPLGANGIHVAGKSLPQLPGSMLQILGSSRRTGGETIHHALSAREPTDWVILGQKTVSFRVEKNKRTQPTDD